MTTDNDNHQGQNGGQLDALYSLDNENESTEENASDNTLPSTDASKIQTDTNQKELFSIAKFIWQYHRIWNIKNGCNFQDISNCF